MKFRSFLNEMTFRAGNLRGGIEPQRKYYEPLILKETLIGEIKDHDDVFNVYKSAIDNEIQFGLYKDEMLITFFNGDFETLPKVGEVYVLKQMLTSEAFSGRHLSAKLMIFLKTRERISIVLGNVHSNDTVKNVRKIAKTLPILAVSWLNISTGEKDKFDADLDAHDTTHVQWMDGPTDWQILIEKFNNTWTPEEGSFTRFVNESKRWDLTTDYSNWEIL